MAKVTTFTVQSRETKHAIKLPIRGTRKEVESYIIGMFSIEPATEDEIRQFAKADVDTIEAGKG